MKCGKRTSNINSRSIVVLSLGDSQCVPGVHRAVNEHHAAHSYIQGTIIVVSPVRRGIYECLIVPEHD